MAATIPISMKFRMTTHIGPLECNNHWNFEFLKIQDGRRPQRKKFRSPLSSAQHDISLASDTYGRVLLQQ